ncbi:DUF72 domain-containing protein [Methylobacter sp. BlB1]|uniref:DUF72 domain-containing protein n=1 Tax=Methylobacter sp. BlB1 TaxID=2785914 RepID=UPI0018951CE0|nr:DUF72 domain-containing protein [Methylobacter sp. BlB1]
MSRFYVGTSGWNYPDWQDGFYAGIIRRDRLKFYAQQFPAVEINGTFYRLQSPDTFQKWAQETPENFRFAIKANRYLTHHKKLMDPAASVLIEKNHAEALKEKLAVVLWQLPGLVKKDLVKLQQFIAALLQWKNVRHTVEFRHASWFDDETAHYLAEAGIAVCLSDAEAWPMWDRVTTDLVYIRLHGHTQTYVSSYSEPELAQWAERIEQWLKQDKQVHVYFDNTAQGAAPHNALELQKLLQDKM